MNRELEPANPMMSQGVDNLIAVDRELIAFIEDNPELSCKEKFDKLLKLCVDHNIGMRGFAYLEARLVGYCKNKDSL